MTKNEVASGLVSCKYLNGKNLARYSKIESIVKAEYSGVLSSIKEPKKLPYAPIVYVIPWVPTKELKKGSMTATLYHYNLMFADPKNFERYGIFSVLNFLERFQKYIAGGLGHEIAHFIQTKGRVELELPQMADFIRNPIQAELRKESDAGEFYDFFNEPTKSAIRNWNKLSTFPEVINEVMYDAETVDINKFCKLIFGDREQQFNEYMTQMVKRKISRDLPKNR